MDPFDGLLEQLDVRIRALGFCEVGPNYSVRHQASDVVLVHFVLGGDGVLLSEHGRLQLGSHSVVMLPKNLAASIRGTGPIDQFLRIDYPAIGAPNLSVLRAHDGSPQLVIAAAALSATLGRDPAIFEQLKIPAVEYGTGRGSSFPIAEVPEKLKTLGAVSSSRVSDIMQHIIAERFSLQSSGTSWGLLEEMDPRVVEVLAKIIEYPAERHTVNSLAKIAEMSSVRFKHCFWMACGCSPYEFLRTVRLSMAARMLQTSEISVETIARAVGYSGHKQLERPFIARYGVAPSLFRQKAQDWGRGFACLLGGGP